MQVFRRKYTKILTSSLCVISPKSLLKKGNNSKHGESSGSNVFSCYHGNEWVFLASVKGTFSTHTHTALATTSSANIIVHGESPGTSFVSAVRKTNKEELEGVIHPPITPTSTLTTTIFSTCINRSSLPEPQADLEEINK